MVDGSGAAMRGEAKNRMKERSEKGEERERIMVEIGEEE